MESETLQRAGDFFEDDPMDRGDDQETQDSDSEFDSEKSESDSASDEIEPTVNYVHNVTNILQDHSVVTIENAIAINQTMQRHMSKLREALEEMLYKCEQKYAKNQQLLEESLQEKRKKIHYRVCGAPFFKDLDMYPAPYNDDYKWRRQYGEVFLMDLKAFRHRYWLINDKQKLVQAIKSQVIDHLNENKSLEKKNAVQMTEKSIELHTNRLATLLHKVGDNFTIDWEMVSSEGLLGRHSAKSCFAMWNGYMKPDLNRGPWTPEENNCLMSVAQNLNFQNWSLISHNIPGRSESQCFVQFQNIVNANLPSNRRWTQEEDDQILKLVKEHTNGTAVNWTSICGFFVNRSKKAIYSRYKNVLNPNLKKGLFSREEDCILMAAIAEYGENFASIPMSLFPNRSRNQVKSRYFNTLKYSNVKRNWTANDDEILIDFVKTHGTGKWAEVASILKGHTRGSCRTRYQVIENFFQKNPNATVKDIPRKNRGTLTDVSKDNWVDKIYELKTIGDIKQQEREKRMKKFRAVKLKRSSTYRGMLRPHARKFYELFKYSFGYRYTDVAKHLNYVRGALPFYYLILDCNTTAVNVVDSRKAFEVEEKAVLKKMCCQTKKSAAASMTPESLVPINWSTVLGLRALTILANSDTYKSAVANQKLKDSPHVKSKELFKQRFVKIFSKTSQLLWIAPDGLVNLKQSNQCSPENTNEPLANTISKDQNGIQIVSPTHTPNGSATKLKL